MDHRQSNRLSGSMGFLSLEGVPTPVRPGSGSRVLKVGCLNVRGCNELKKRDEIGRMF